MTAQKGGPSREGKKSLQAFVTLDEWRELRDIGSDTQRTQTELFREAVTLLFDKYRRGECTNGRHVARQNKRKPTRALKHG